MLNEQELLKSIEKEAKMTNLILGKILLLLEKRDKK
jgi:hypothetical protein